MADKDEPSPHGVHVAPGINAQHHQHLFSVRVDPMVDGLQNSVVETDVRRLEAKTGSAENFAGNGFVTCDRVLREAREGERAYDAEADRRWQIVNAGRRHPVSGLLAGYSLGLKGGATPLMAQTDSWVGQRAAFARSALWVLRDVEGELGSRMWPSGKYVPRRAG